MTTPSHPTGSFDIINSDIDQHITRAHQLRSEFVRHSAAQFAAAIGRAFTFLTAGPRRSGAAVPPNAGAGSAA